MKLVPHYNDCFCDYCMIKHHREGLIHEGTPAHNDYLEIMKKPDRPTMCDYKQGEDDGGEE